MTIHEWMTAATKPGAFSPPGLVVAVNDTIDVCGTDAAGVPLTAESIWPLACLTKLAIADLTVRLLDRDRLITSWLPEVGLPVTVRQLLTHTSGLPLDLPAEAYGRVDADEVRDLMITTQPIQAPGPVSYSNIGYGWLALAVERVTGTELGKLLGAYGLGWGDDLRTPPVTIADVRSPHAKTPLEPFNSTYWRALRLPWAGAFGSVRAVQRLIDGLSAHVCEPPRPAAGGFPPGAYFGFDASGGCTWTDAAWSCGVEFRGTKTPHWISPRASATSYGHVGSSGLLVWRDGGRTIVIGGPRTTDGGWMLRHGPKASDLALTAPLQATFRASA